MLEAALKFKKVFEILDGDVNYTKYFEEERVNGKKLDGPPIHHDWEKAQVLENILQGDYKNQWLFICDIQLVFQGNLCSSGKFEGIG